MVTLLLWPLEAAPPLRPRRGATLSSSFKLKPRLESRPRDGGPGGTLATDMEGCAGGVAVAAPMQAGEWHVLDVYARSRMEASIFSICPKLKAFCASCDAYNANRGQPPTRAHLLSCAQQRTQIRLDLRAAPKTIAAAFCAHAGALFGLGRRSLLRHIRQRRQARIECKATTAASLTSASGRIKQ